MNRSAQKQAHDLCPKSGCERSTRRNPLISGQSCSKLKFTKVNPESERFKVILEPGLQRGERPDCLLDGFVCKSGNALISENNAFGADAVPGPLLVENAVFADPGFLLKEDSGIRIRRHIRKFICHHPLPWASDNRAPHSSQEISACRNAGVRPEICPRRFSDDHRRESDPNSGFCDATG